MLRFKKACSRSRVQTVANQPWFLSNRRQVSPPIAGYASQSTRTGIQRVLLQREILTLSRHGLSEEKTDQKNETRRNLLFSDGLSPRVRKLSRKTVFLERVLSES